MKRSPALISLAIVPLALLAALGTGINGTSAAHADPPATACTLIVPFHPQEAKSLATPYQLAGPGCSEANPATSAFVQATIVDPAGNVAVYSPLVIDAGTTPAVAPVVPVVTPGATVALWFGFNGISLHLQGKGLESCQNGLTPAPGHGAPSDFGQFAYCHGPALYQAMNALVASGKLTVPPLGVSASGDACPSVASFAIVDQDPSDNVQTTYLSTPGGVVQDTLANRAAFPSATVVGNPSDNALLTQLVDPAIGCTPWTVMNLADPNGAPVASYALDEFQARALQAAPFASVPLMDEMTLVNGVESGPKTTLYRRGADEQPSADGSDLYYCTNLAKIAPAWLTLHKAQLQAAASPSPADSTLFAFMADRFVATYEMVLPTPGVVPTCDTVTGIPDPVGLITQVTGATITP